MECKKSTLQPKTQILDESKDWELFLFLLLQLMTHESKPICT